MRVLRADGLTLETFLEGDVHLKVRATDDPGEVGPVDLLWFCVKMYDVEAAEQVAAVLGEAPVLGCVSVAGGTLVAPGVVAQKVRRMHVKFGERSGGASRRADDLRDFLRDGFLRGSIGPGAGSHGRGGGCRTCQGCSIAEGQG